MSDHFDHYQRPPSRDSSVDRYTRAASRLSGNSRQPSVDRNKPLAEPVPATDHSRASSVLRSTTPATNPGTGNGSVIGAAAAVAATNLQNRLQPATNSSAAPSGHGFPVPPFEDFILRKRSLGQEIVPSPVGQPKRTESLYVGAAAKKESHTKVSLMIELMDQSSMPRWIPAMCCNTSRVVLIPVGFQVEYLHEVMVVLYSRRWLTSMVVAADERL